MHAARAERNWRGCLGASARSLGPRGQVRRRTRILWRKNEVVSVRVRSHGVLRAGGGVVSADALNWDWRCPPAWPSTNETGGPIAITGKEDSTVSVKRARRPQIGRGGGNMFPEKEAKEADSAATPRHGFGVARASFGTKLTRFIAL